MTDLRAFYAGPRWGWVLTCHDAHGNQLWDAQYFPNRAALAAALGV